MMAKRAIEEEFDRLYSDFIENPEALPRLKKRAKRCRQLTESPQHQGSSSSTISDVTCLLSSTVKTELACPITTKCSSSATEGNASVWVSSELGIGQQQDTKYLQPKKPSTHSTMPVSSSSPANKTDDQEESYDRVQPTHPSQPSIDEVTDDVINSSHGKEDADMTAKIQLGEHESQAASDIFMLHKPRINRVQSQQKSLNLDALWALYAKTWLLPKRPAVNQIRPVFLQRNLRRGCIFFKRYLIHQKALKDLSKPKLSSHQQEPQAAGEHVRSNSSKKEAAVKEAKAKDASSDYQNRTKLKLESGECSRAQKRKDVKPKPVLCVIKKPLQTKTDASKVMPKGYGQDVVAKVTTLKPGKLASKTKTVLQSDSGSGQVAFAKAKPVKSEKHAVKTGPQRDSRKVKPVQTRKQSLKKEEASSRKPLSTESSKQVWTKEASGGRQVAICRPNTKGKASKVDAASTSEVKMKFIEEENPECQLPSTKPPQEKPQAFPVSSTSAKDMVNAAEDVGVSGGIKPLFSGGHCGGIWKSIVDEC
ncbi:uncharacterized protein LOC119739123 [Patiria miniata]|uniref:Uncharacterized protein n=1 Tax=Patiria miniata TaxID=46514 RepID=A0A914B0F7_PATMI|nr:uncharacterized protein LOC119739123 [Patiria miniata]